MSVLAFQPLDPVVALRRSMIVFGWQPLAIYNPDAVCNSPGKQPFGTNWQNIRGMPPNVPVARNTGVLCRNIRGVDADIDDQEASKTAERIVVETLGSSRFVRRRSNSARFLIVYQGTGSKRVIHTAAGDVEILGSGQQFVGFGTHKSGGVYEWDDVDPGNETLDAEAIGEDDFDKLEAALIAALGAKTHRSEGASSSARYRRPDASPYVSAALSRECEAVRSAPNGRQEWTLNAAALSIGHYVGAHHLSFSEALSALLDAAMQMLNFDPRRPWRANELRQKIDRGIRDGMKDPKDPPPRDDREIDDEMREAIDGMAVGSSSKSRADQDNPGGQEPAGVEPEPTDPFATIELGRGVDWTQVDGLMGDIASWIMKTARWPNRALSVASAASIISAICGRWLYGPTESSLGLYIVGLAATGVGKNRPLDAPGQLLRSAHRDLGSLHASGKVFSVSGLESIMTQNPCALATVDEMGNNLFARISHKNASTDVQAIRQALQELWSRNRGAGPWHSTGRASSRSVEVHSPNLTIFGVSTPEQFYEALKSGDVASGFLNRFLIVHAEDDNVRPNDFRFEAPPESILAEIRALIPGRPEKGDIGPCMAVYGPAAEVGERRLEWAPDGAARAAEQFEISVREICKTHPRGDMMMRVYEYAVRLACIRAVSRVGTRACVSLADLEWGAAWSMQSARWLLEGADAMMARSDYEGHLKEVREAIRKARSISKNNLTRTLQHIPAKVREAIVFDLVEARVITRDIQQTGKIGVRPTVYNWVG